MRRLGNDKVHHRRKLTELLGWIVLLVWNVRFSLGYTNCDECPGDHMCILESTTSMMMNSNRMSVKLSICRFQPSFSKENLSFLAHNVPSCMNATRILPLIQSISASCPQESTNCTCEKGQPCLLQVAFEQPVDWALCGNKDLNISNYLIAKANEEVEVPVSLLCDVNDPVVRITTQYPDARCGKSISVSGSQFSNVKECNLVSVCIGKGGGDAETCLPNLYNLQSDGCIGANNSGQCAGTIDFVQPLPCLATQNGDSIRVVLNVGDSKPFSSTPVPLTYHSPVLKSIGQVNAGSSEFYAVGDHFCTENGEFSWTPSQSIDLTLPPVMNISSDLNREGYYNITLQNPLDFAWGGLNMVLKMSVCGVFSQPVQQVVQTSPPYLDVSNYPYISGQKLNINITGGNFSKTASLMAATLYYESMTRDLPVVEILSSTENSMNIQTDGILPPIASSVHLLLSVSVKSNNLSSSKVMVALLSPPSSDLGIDTSRVQKDTSHAGLSGGVYAGISIAFAAFVGVLAEFYFLKKRLLNEESRGFSDTSDSI